MNAKLGQLLLDSGIITDKQLEEALTLQGKDGGRLGYHLVNINAISEPDLNLYLARQQSIEAIDLDKTEVDPDVLALIPSEIAWRYEVIPLERDGRTLIVAMTDPHNLFAIDDLRFSLGMEIEPHICASSMVKRAISKFYKEGEAIVPVDGDDQTGSTMDTALVEASGAADEVTEMLIGDEVFE